MTEKRVSVRLGAEGGDNVRSELNSVGRSGEQAMDKVGAASARADRQLAAFARRAKIAAAAIATAAVAAAGAMVRSGLQTIDAQAKLAASLDTTVESIQVLERAGDLAGVSMGQVEQATIQLTRRLSMAAAGTGPAVDALDRLRLSAEELQELPLDERLALIQSRLAEFVPEAERASVATQLFGDRAGLVFTRIDTDTLRQATADVRDFGVAVSDQDAAQIERTNDAISRLGMVWRGVANQLTVAVAPILESIANGLAEIARAAGPFGSAINTVLDNLDRLGTYATVAAGALLVSLAPAAGAAALAVGRLTTALLASRAALARTGWGLAVLALGEIAYRMELFGSATEASNEAQERMNEALDRYATDRGPAARAEAVAATQDYLAQARAKMESAEASLTLMEAELQQFQNAHPEQRGLMGDLEEGAMARNIAAAREEVAKLREAFVLARNRLAELEDADPAAPIITAANATNQLTARLGASVTRARQLVTALGQAPGAIRSLQEQGEVLEAGLAAAARGADEAAISSAQYRAELEQTYGLAEAGSEAERAYFSAIINRQVAEHEANEQRKAALNEYIAGLGQVEAASGRAGGAARELGEASKRAAEEAATGWERTTQSLDAYAESAQDILGQLGETVVKGFKGAEDAIRKFAMGGKLDFRNMVQSMLADLAVLLARRTILGPLASALSGVFSGGFGGGFGGNIISGATFLHSGGQVGRDGTRGTVSALAFAGAPRFHSGVDTLGLRPDEVPAILQRGEKVLSKNEVQRGAGSRVMEFIFHLPEGVTLEQVGEIATGISIRTMQAGLRRNRDSLSSQLAAVDLRGN